MRNFRGVLPCMPHMRDEGSKHCGIVALGAEIDDDLHDLITGFRCLQVPVITLRNSPTLSDDVWVDIIPQGLLIIFGSLESSANFFLPSVGLIASRIYWTHNENKNAHIA